MKIKKILVCIVLCALCITGCKNETKEYVLTNTSIDADELVEAYKDGNECEDIRKNEKGNVVVLLTEEQREAWLKSPGTEDINSINEAFSFDISYNDEYTELEIKASKEIIIAFEEMVMLYAYHAEVQQVLNGKEDWELTITLIETDTNTIWHTFSLPEEELDWSMLQEEYK